MHPYEQSVLAGYMRNFLIRLGVDSTRTCSLCDFILHQFSGLRIKIPAKLRHLCHDPKNKDREIRAQVLSLLETKHAKLDTIPHSPLHRMLEALGEDFNLTAIQRDILGLLLRHASGNSEWFFHQVVNISLTDSLSEGIRLRERNHDVVAALLGRSLASVCRELGLQARLSQSGLIEVQDEGEFQLNGVVRRAVIHNRTAKAMRSCLLGKQSKATLHWRDFEHMHERRDHIEKLLRGATGKKAKGINILLYGNVGTGKTEFCKTLAQRLNLKLFMVGEGGRQASGLSREERISALSLAQRLTAGRDDTLLLMDEAGEVFDLIGNSRKRTRVAFLRMLEENAIPILWTVNEVGRLPAAIVRRMTFALNFSTPPLEVRRRIWDRVLDRERIQIPRESIHELATSYDLAPALTASAVRGASLCEGGIDEIKLSMDEAARAMNGGRKPKRPGNDVSHGRSFEPGLINGGHSLDTLIGQLAKRGQQAFSILLYGPPGTGKSAFLRHLAKQLEMDILEKRASDMLSPWVGGTEHSFAEAFEEAASAKSFLIIDEVDSFLFDRSQASRSWERSQVNELLRCMEDHPHPWGCTTNAIDSIDPAALRRFTFKEAFDYLSGEQIAAAFSTIFGRPAPAEWLALPKLTIGDIVTVKNKADVLNLLGDDAALMELVSKELTLKGALKERIGFGRR
ncbi:MAG: ATP-binding protein [Planctomycetaceae bacterium]|nr:ATP-binding protein [Planctomycetaceae bacterium]